MPTHCLELLRNCRQLFSGVDLGLCVPQMRPDCGASNITTIEYNEPRVQDPALALRVRTLDTRKLAEAYAAGLAFDVIVSFSGIEHDGLGRYGDPLNADGDLALARELQMLLKPGGTLLLGIPTHCVEHDGHCFAYNGRVYGPGRLPRLLQGYTVDGWCWAGQACTRGSLQEADRPPNAASWEELWYRGKRPRPWVHQPVLALSVKDSGQELRRSGTRVLSAWPTRACGRQPTWVSRGDASGPQCI